MRTVKTADRSVPTTVTRQQEGRIRFWLSTRRLEFRVHLAIGEWFSLLKIHRNLRLAFTDPHLCLGERRQSD